MPIFEYQCQKCSHRFEFLTTTDGKAPDKCPSCGAAAPTKLFSSFAVSSGSNACESGHCGGDFDSNACGSCSGAGGCPYSGGFDE